MDKKYMLIIFSVLLISVVILVIARNTYLAQNVSALFNDLANSTKYYVKNGDIDGLIDRLESEGKSPEVCEKIIYNGGYYALQEVEPKDYCYTRFAIKRADESICNRGKYAGDCAVRIAVSKKDIEVCNVLEYMREACMVTVADRLRDVSLCEFIKNDFYKKECTKHFPTVRNQ